VCLYALVYGISAMVHFGWKELVGWECVVDSQWLDYLFIRAVLVFYPSLPPLSPFLHLVIIRISISPLDFIFVSLRSAVDNPLRGIMVLFYGWYIYYFFFLWVKQANMATSSG